MKRVTEQTAVDWLIEVLWAPCQGIPSDIIEQAKAMEKEQKESYYKLGYVHGVGDSRLTNMIIDKNK